MQNSQKRWRHYHSSYYLHPPEICITQEIIFSFLFMTVLGYLGQMEVAPKFTLSLPWKCSWISYLTLYPLHFKRVSLKAICLIRVSVFSEIGLENIVYYVRDNSCLKMLSELF